MTKLVQFSSAHVAFLTLSALLHMLGDTGH
eukprot:SAG31_NODE_31416_length_368_cov_1.148699_1_plen_29_part_10